MDEYSNIVVKSINIGSGRQINTKGCFEVLGVIQAPSLQCVLRQSFPNIATPLNQNTEIIHQILTESMCLAEKDVVAYVKTRYLVLCAQYLSKGYTVDTLFIKTNLRDCFSLEAGV